MKSIVIIFIIRSSSDHRSIQPSFVLIIVKTKKRQDEIVVNLVVQVECQNMFIELKIDFFCSSSSSGSGSSSTIITFNSSSFIDYRSEQFLDYPLRLSVRFRTIGRISTGVLLSFAYHKSNTSTIPFIIIEHSQSKIEMTILQLDEREALSTVTVILIKRKKRLHLQYAKCEHRTEVLFFPVSKVIADRCL